jgi:hypothetical protein
METKAIITNWGSINAEFAASKTEAEFIIWVDKTFANREFYAKMLKDKRTEWAKAYYKQAVELVGKPAKVETKKEGDK